MTKLIAVLLGATLAALVFCPLTFAQVDTGTITGTVTDPAGSVVQGASVTITYIEQNTSQSLVTNDRGIYEAKFLPIGGYVVTVSKPGFKQSLTKGLVLTVGQVMRVDVGLQVGVTQEKVEVTAGAQQAIETETSEVGQVITARQVADLPLNGRNFTDLIPLNAGVGTGAPGQTNGGYNFNGSRSDQNMFLIEGADNININNNLLVNPTIESIQEFQVLTGTFSAEYGRSAGGIVTVKLKSGTNRWHGSLFEFLRNDKLDANGYFNNQVQASDGSGIAPRSPLKRNQYGGSLGGPIIKNKTFFFADYQGSRDSEGRSTIQSVPTALERAGDFTQTLSPGQILYQNALLGTTYPGCDPANFTPETCQVMPSSGMDGIDPVAAKVIALYPSPNRAGAFIPGTGTLNNFITSATTITNTHQFNVKIDHQLTSRDSLSAHYSFNKIYNLVPAAFGGGTVGPCVNCGFTLDLLAGTPLTRSQNFGLAWVHTISPTTINEFHVGLSRNHLLYQTSDGGHNLAEELGIANVNVSPLTTGLPWFYLSPSPSWIGTSPFTPAVDGYTSYQFSDNLTHLVGRHALKVGVDLRRRLDNNGGNFFGKGEYVFVPLFTGNAFGDFLSGRPTTIGQDLTPGTIGLREIEYAAYFQDDFKVNKRLTLNLGLRYEIYPGLVEVNNRMSTLDQMAGTVALAGKNGSPRQFVDTNYKNLGPRVGFAYSFNEKADTVVRGGYGISYSNITDPIAKAGLNPPYTQSFSYFNIGADSDAAFFIKDGLPIQLSPTVENFDPNNPAGSYRVVARDAPVPYTQYFSLNVQRALPADMIFEIGYVGTRGTHLPGQNEGNPAPPGDPATVEQRRIYHDSIPNVGSTTLFENVFSSKYDSLQVKLSKRFSHGLQFLTTYTFSKSIDDLSGSSVTGGGETNPSAKPQDPFDISADRGLSSFNRAHRFVSSFSYELPFGRGHAVGSDWGRVTNGFLGGWQLNGILTIASGLPFSVFASPVANCGCSVNDLRADLIGDPHKHNQGPNGWFNIAAFADPAGGYGNSPRDLIVGPGYGNLDASLFKKFVFAERHQFEFRAEFFNILNRTNFQNPTSANSTWQSGGIITQNYPARIGQVAFKYSF